MATFVQFPHPGPEHCPESDDMPWNTGAHGRKFLISEGSYLADNEVRQGEPVFWGEWEPPSHVERRWPRDGRLPRALHRPYWGRGIGQNTDPWVFGDRMRYSNCRQVRDERRPTSMQTLSPGSVICFGSKIDYEFCVDTVFVVAEAERWTPAESADLGEDEAFLACTAEQLAAGADARTPFTLYRGATFENPVHGMYSFVPALPADGEGPRFARPALRMPGLIGPGIAQNTWGSKRPLAVAEVREAWDTVREQVFAAGLVLATHLETPDRSATPESAAGKGVGCAAVQTVACAGTVTSAQEVRPRERCSDVGAPLPSTVGRLT
ncbi:hypothetical protein VA596_38640 [Amycolatopsis sp., V23-08]|uniref:DUF2169 domain-containing protein n=1 Tax=Amycolatopsis heterodermiae TaxID=3110235 RepID=A0ABU5RK39_9PSEU|nr:hypothetical protein [Amycolatopsis sp., V23-08]MEA5365496.1 hypothetical protein [Amycolatopsis sp., V23-08]